MAHATGKESHLPVPITADISRLSEYDRETLGLLIEAVHVADSTYLQQMRHEAILPDMVFSAAKEPFAYPANTTKEELDAFLEQNHGMHAEILSPFTIVIRTDSGFDAVPYTKAYADGCQRLYALLTEAGTRINQPYMRDYLMKRGLAFETNRFRESDIAWIQANDSPFELIIGPYESYADSLYGVKRTFEGILGIVCIDETARANMFQDQIQSFDAMLGTKYGYETAPTLTPMVVIDEIAAGGESLYEYIPMACNLPNDTDIHQEVGSKKVFIRNVMEAKFRTMTLQIAKRVLPPDLLSMVDFEAMLLFVIGHEGSHGISFHFTGEEFGTHHSSLEECKADVFGILFLCYLADQGVLDQSIVDRAVITHLTDALRQIRFGLAEAHAVGSLIQYNWPIQHTALQVTADGLSFHPQLFRTAFEWLGEELYKVCKTKDSEKAKAFIAEWGSIPAALPKLTEKLADIPVDIDLCLRFE